MKIYSKVVIDIDSGEIITESVIDEDYDGPIAECGGGDSGGGGGGGDDDLDLGGQEQMAGGRAGTGSPGEQYEGGDTGPAIREPLYVVPPAEQPTTSIADAAKAGARMGGPYLGILSGAAVALDRAMGNEGQRELASEREPERGGDTRPASRPSPAPAPAPAAPPPPPKPTRADYEGMVRGWYGEHLGRSEQKITEDISGVNAWVEELVSGRMTPEAVEQRIYGSGEAQAHRNRSQYTGRGGTPSYEGDLIMREMDTGVIEPGGLVNTGPVETYDDMVGSLLLTALEEEELLREGRTGRELTLLSGGQGLLNRPRIRRSRVLGTTSTG